jgi:hypothetical protein
MHITGVKQKRAVVWTGLLINYIVLRNPRVERDEKLGIGALASSSFTTERESACAREKGSARAGEIDRSREENGGRRTIEHGWCGYYATEVGSHILELLGWRIVR